MKKQFSLYAARLGRESCVFGFASRSPLPTTRIGRETVGAGCRRPLKAVNCINLGDAPHPLPGSNPQPLNERSEPTATRASPTRLPYSRFPVPRDLPSILTTSRRRERSPSLLYSTGATKPPFLDDQPGSISQIFLSLCLWFLSIFRAILRPRNCSHPALL